MKSFAVVFFVLYPGPAIGLDYLQQQTLDQRIQQVQSTYPSSTQQPSSDFALSELQLRLNTLSDQVEALVPVIERRVENNRTRKVILEKIMKRMDEHSAKALYYNEDWLAHGQERIVRLCCEIVRQKGLPPGLRQRKKQDLKPSVLEQ